MVIKEVRCPVCLTKVPVINNKIAPHHRTAGDKEVRCSGSGKSV